MHGRIMEDDSIPPSSLQTTIESESNTDSHEPSAQTAQCNLGWCMLIILYRQQKSSPNFKQ